MILKDLIFLLALILILYIILQVTYFLSSLVLAYAVGFMIAVVVELPRANLEALVWRKWENK